MMNHLRVLYAACAVMCASAAAGQSVTPAPIPVPEGYSLVWNDEFDVVGAPNPDVWRHEQGFVRNNELQWYQPDNAVCRDGYLVIEARREKRPNPTYQAGSRDWKRSREYVEYTSSSINTSGHKTWQYGRFEVRARVNGQLGSWPAIWTLGVEKHWPTNGEIDIMEYYHIQGVPNLLANVAWGGEPGRGATWDSSHTPLTHFNEKDARWLSQFHTWRMDWTAEYIRLYLDDELLNETDVTKTLNPDGFNPFHQPHYILLNLAIGGQGGDPTNSDFPLLYEVDYVRVYQPE
jgi:beta-glucanase (GH16 family)